MGKQQPDIHQSYFDMPNAPVCPLGTKLVKASRPCCRSRREIFPQVYAHWLISSVRLIQQTCGIRTCLATLLTLSPAPEISRGELVYWTRYCNPSRLY